MSGKARSAPKTGNHRSSSTDLDQVDVHQRVPGRGDVSLDDGCDGVRDVVDRQEIVNQHAQSMSPSDARRAKC